MRRKVIKVILGFIFVSITMFSLFLLLRGQLERKEQIKSFNIPAFTHLEIRNPEIALKYGIRGYMEINPSPNFPKSLSVGRGEEVSVTLLLCFVSHTPELTEIKVNIDPGSDRGFGVEQHYVVLDEKGNITERGTINLSELVSYKPSGTVVLKANETLPVVMTLAIPKDLPKNIDPSSFPLDAVGIWADIPILSTFRPPFVYIH